MNNIGIPDLPIQHSKEDIFKVDTYVTALSDFIRECETPITIALQGGWGTGKTSFMNLINQNLNPKECIGEKADQFNQNSNILFGTQKQKKNSNIITVKFNTWQYSQFHLQENLGISFLSYMIEKLAQDNSSAKEYKEKAMQTLKIISLVTTNAFLSPFNASINPEDFKTNKDTSLDPAKAIEDLKYSLQKIVSNKLENKDGNKERTKNRLVIFIDDLDRLNPAVTVNLLEVIKLFLDIPNCVFVLAVDNRVIEEGITATKGTSKEKTKSFLDKMVQVPFKIPIENYDYGKFLKGKIDLLQDEKSASSLPTKEIEGLIRYSVGSNPRAMKRFINNYILNKKVNSILTKKDSKSSTSQDKIDNTLLLAVICMQLGFQPLYMTLLNESDDEILNILNKTLDGENDKDFIELLRIKVTESNLFEMFDENKDEVMKEIPRYDKFLALLHTLLAKLYNKFVDTKQETENSDEESNDTIELTKSDITKFIEILQRSQMTSGSQLVTEGRKELQLGEQEILPIEKVINKAKSYELEDSPILFNEKRYSPKEGFKAILNYYATPDYIDLLNDASLLKNKKVSSIIYNPLLPVEEQKQNKYSTITFHDNETGQKKVTLGYHFSARESLRQLYKILNDVLEVEDINANIKIVARSIENS